MTKEMQLYQVPIGDWSSDGHGKYDTFYVYANYSAPEMAQAYKNTCKKIGLQMNHNENYTGLKEADNYGSWRLLLTEYEEYSISEKAVKILLEHGFDFKRVDGERDENGNFIIQEAYFYAEGVFDLFMWFISYSMPDDFKYQQYELNVPSIIGWWNSDLNHQIGYGIYD